MVVTYILQRRTVKRLVSIEELLSSIIPRHYKLDRFSFTRSEIKLTGYKVTKPSRSTCLVENFVRLNSAQPDGLCNTASTCGKFYATKPTE